MPDALTGLAAGASWRAKAHEICITANKAGLVHGGAFTSSTVGVRLGEPCEPPLGGTCEGGMTLEGALSTGREGQAALLQSLPACPNCKTQEAGLQGGRYMGHWLRCMVPSAVGYGANWAPRKVRRQRVSHTRTRLGRPCHVVSVLPFILVPF